MTFLQKFIRLRERTTLEKFKLCQIGLRRLEKKQPGTVGFFAKQMEKCFHDVHGDGKGGLILDRPSDEVSQPSYHTFWNIASSLDECFPVAYDRFRKKYHHIITHE